VRDAQDAIIGYLLIGTEVKAGALQSAIFNSANFSSIATDAKGVIQIFNVGAERMLGYTAAEVMNRSRLPISDPQEVIARAEALSVELGTPITPGFESPSVQGLARDRGHLRTDLHRKDGVGSRRWCPSRRSRRTGCHYRLSAHRHGQHRTQVGRSRAKEV